MDRTELTRLPAFIEEAFGNVSLSAMITAYRDDDAVALLLAMNSAVDRYAREWIADTMNRNGYTTEADAIAYGIRLFSAPVTAVGL